MSSKGTDKKAWLGGWRAPFLDARSLPPTYWGCKLEGSVGPITSDTSDGNSKSLTEPKTTTETTGTEYHNPNLYNKPIPTADRTLPGCVSQGDTMGIMWRLGNHHIPGNQGLLTFLAKPAERTGWVVLYSWL